MRDPLLGQVVRDYEVLERLGHGGMGRVYRVRHRQLGVERAMKFVVPEVAGDAEMAKRFEREASALASMRHPNLVGFYEFGALDDGTQYLVMECLDGESLQGHLGRRGALGLAVGAELFIDVCSGLEEVHRHGIIHRDISPDNIFLAATVTGPVAKLIDFGIALPLDGSTISRLTKTGHFLGKLAYASPEQLGRLPAGEDLDHRSDLYSLGVVIHESLTGEPVFATSSPSAIVVKKLQESPRSLSDCPTREVIPSALDHLVASLLERERERRPPSAGAVRRALEGVLKEVSRNATQSQPTRAVSGTQTTELPTSAVEHRIGEYSVEELLGQGGMGAVYRARHTLLGVTRALKVVKPELLKSPRARERFLREARILAQLDHPNLVGIHECGTLPTGSYYLVQDYLEGETLAERISRTGRLEPGAAARLIAEAARGLDAAHRGGVIHRDVSPDNLMLVQNASGEETVRVIDFGLAKAIMDDGAPELTSAGVFLGKLAYCSPEQAGKLEEGESLDGRSDIYSLGVALFRALTGRLPFEAPTPIGYLAKHLTAAPPTPRSLGIELPEALEAVLLRMLRKDRDERPQTMAEVAELLLAAVGGPVPATGLMTAIPLTPAMPATSISPAATPTNALPRRLAQALGPALLLLAMFAVNVAETAIESWLAGSGTSARAYSFATAFHWFEGRPSFEHHDLTSGLAVYGYSTAYFFLFPALLLAVAVALALRADRRPFRVYAGGITVCYLLSLPFYLLLPVPERWAFPESEAILLSDLWSSRLIEAVRPLSGLDNCFPSAHVSLTVVALVTAWSFGLRFRTMTLPIGGMIILSTYVLGIHWLPDIIAGLGLGVTAVALAERLTDRVWPTPPTVLEDSSMAVSDSGSTPVGSG